GLRLRHVLTWPASPPARRARRTASGDLVERLRVRGTRAVAPELIEAVDTLVGSAENDGRSRLVFAPDDCGQAEVVALTAELLDERLHAATLVVTAGNPEALAAELARWLAPGRRAV